MQRFFSQYVLLENLFKGETTTPPNAIYKKNPETSKCIKDLNVRLDFIKLSDENRQNTL